MEVRAGICRVLWEGYWQNLEGELTHGVPLQPQTPCWPSEEQQVLGPSGFQP